MSFPSELQTRSLEVHKIVRLELDGDDIATLHCGLQGGLPTMARRACGERTQAIEPMREQPLRNSIQQAGGLGAVFRVPPMRPQAPSENGNQQHRTESAEALAWHWPQSWPRSRRSPCSWRWIRACEICQTPAGATGGSGIRAQKLK